MMISCGSFHQQHGSTSASSCPPDDEGACVMMEMENSRERNMLKFHMHRNFECFRVEEIEKEREKSVEGRRNRCRNGF